MKSIFVGVVAIFLLPVPLAGQERPAACGALEVDIVDVASVAEYFTSDAFSWLREENRIRRVGSTAPQYLVTNPSICQAAHARAVARYQLRSRQLLELEPGSYDFSVFRIGPYLTVVLLDTRGCSDPGSPDGSELIACSRDGTASFMVFRASDLRYLFSFAV